MKEKTQYEALVEELQKIGENFKVGFTEIGEILSKYCLTLKFLMKRKIHGK